MFPSLSPSSPFFSSFSFPSSFPAPSRSHSLLFRLCYVHSLLGFEGEVKVIACSPTLGDIATVSASKSSSESLDLFVTGSEKRDNFAQIQLLRYGQ